jgi:hypothetical protein
VTSAPPDLQQMVFSSMQMESRSRSSHPLLDKFSSAHVHKFLDHIEKEDVREYKLACSNRWYVLGYAVMGAALFVFLIVYLMRSNKELLYDIFKIAAGFAGGFGLGFGIKKKK